MISPDWVNISHEDECSGLDKVARNPPVLKERTQSSPFFSSKEIPSNKKKDIIVEHEILTENCRSISDPDLSSSTDKERCSISSGEGDIEGGSVNINQTDIERLKKENRTFVRYSDNSLERPEVKEILDSLAGDGQGSGSGGGTKWKGKKVFRSRQKHKDIQKIKKSNRIFHSSEDILECPGGTEKEGGRRSSSSSPQETHSPIPKKKNGTGIFKLSKKKKMSVPVVSPLEDPFSKEASSSPTLLEPGNLESQGLSNGHASPLLSANSDEHVVSSPISLTSKQEEPDANFNLQTLLLPVNENWVKCGYLWLRMKLPNGRYAWTHIVSHYLAIYYY